MVSYRRLLITVLHLQQTHLINLFSPNSKSEFGMLKRPISRDKFVISTIPSSCNTINQNKFIVCVYTLFTSSGIFIDKRKAISSCGWNYYNIRSVYSPQTIKAYHQNSDSYGSVYRHSPDITWKEELH